MNELPFISIITVCYNSEKTLKDTFDSILAQHYPFMEYIVIDGKSTDGTVNIIKTYENSFCSKKINYIWKSEPDKGLYNAMNKGLQLANGELVGIINSDDWYEPQIISKIADFYLINQKPDLVHGNLNVYSDTKKFIETRYPKNIKKIWEDMIIKHPTCFVKKKVYEEIGGFKETFKICSDYDFILRVYKNQYIIKYYDTIITHMRMGGISDKFLRKSWKEAELSSIENGLNRLLARYFHIQKIAKREIIKITRKHINEC